MSSTLPPHLEGLDYVQPLGSGGYADVFLYEQQMPRMKVAVKVLKTEGLTPAIKRQFIDEANTMAQLADHPYIVQVFRAGTSGDARPYLVMKYYPPPTLAQRARAARFSVEEVLRTGIQLSSAVETAHRAGVIHRDIKPANVLVSQDGSPGLTDFGIAGRGGVDEHDDDVGVSVPWAPPEVLFGQSNGDARADVYALAATLWQLLVGRSPFEVPGGDNSTSALMPRIRSEVPPNTGRADVPQSLERLLAQAMSKNPLARSASAIEFARSLQQIEQDERFPGPRSSSSTSSVSPVTPGPYRGGFRTARGRRTTPAPVRAQPPGCPRRRWDNRCSEGSSAVDAASERWCRCRSPTGLPTAREPTEHLGPAPASAPHWSLRSATPPSPGISAPESDTRGTDEGRTPPAADRRWRRRPAARRRDHLRGPRPHQ